MYIKCAICGCEAEKTGRNQKSVKTFCECNGIECHIKRGPIKEATQ